MPWKKQLELQQPLGNYKLFPEIAYGIQHQEIKQVILTATIQQSPYKRFNIGI